MLSARYRAALERNSAEIQRAMLNLELLKAMEAYGHLSSDEAKVAYYALFNDYVAHCIRVLEDSGGAASFWYLYKTQQDVFDEAAKSLEVQLSDLREMSKKLKHIRDKTHFHIDRDGVLDPRKVWREADIKGTALANVVAQTWGLINAGRIHAGLEQLPLPALRSAVITRATRILDGHR
jgi:hypothetical protein